MDKIEPCLPFSKRSARASRHAPSASASATTTLAARPTPRAAPAITFRTSPTPDGACACKPPPVAYSSLPVHCRDGGKLLSDYSVEGDFAPYHWTKGPNEVAAAVTEALEEILAP